MTQKFIAAIDQGTASSRCIVFDETATVRSVGQREHRQLFPRPGWVEHDPEEIWVNVVRVVGECLRKLGIGVADLTAIGIANQRETTVLWDRRTGDPIHNAITWQDTRTDHLVQELGGEIGQGRFRKRCGLPLATYFSGPKIRWLLDHSPALQERAQAGEIAFGTMDSWLIWKLTGRHVTDVTNACRTMLMNLETLDWDDELLDAMGVPRVMLPEIRPSTEVYGEAGGPLAGLPVASALGDQHAALFGQTCFERGEAKCTYGTGSFMLMNTGETPVWSESGLLTTVGYKIGDRPATYALEGSIAVTGYLVQWFRDKLGLIRTAAEIETLARTVDDSGGCYFVPAFAGLFAPHWRSDARGVIAGLTGYITKGHLARAVLEATGWQTREVVEAMNSDAGVELSTLKVDGGMTANNLLMQFIADVLDVPVVRPLVAETVSLGAAYAAGLATGFWPDMDSLHANWHRAGEWVPGMEARERERGYRKWKKAVALTLEWVDDDDDDGTVDFGIVDQVGIVERPVLPNVS
jgi:glycerol kinase